MVAVRKEDDTGAQEMCIRLKESILDHNDKDLSKKFDLQGPIPRVVDHQSEVVNVCASLAIILSSNIPKYPLGKKTLGS